jgi:hypothetical protein
MCGSNPGIRYASFNKTSELMDDVFETKLRPQRLFEIDDHFTLTFNTNFSRTFHVHVLTDFYDDSSPI